MVAHFREKRIHTRFVKQVDMLEDKNKLDQIGNELQRPGTLSPRVTVPPPCEVGSMEAGAMNRERERERK